jgi:hypothetical protein
MGNPTEYRRAAAAAFLAAALSVFFAVKAARTEEEEQEPGAGDEEELKVDELEYPGVDPEKGGEAPLLEKAKKQNKNVVTWPGFQMLSEGGGSRVFVQLLKGSKVDAISRPVRIDQAPFKTEPGALVYMFPRSMVLLRNNYNPLITKYFNTPVSKAEMKRRKKRVYLVIEMKTEVQPVREKFVKYKDDFYFFFVEFEHGNYLETQSPLNQ